MDDSRELDSKSPLLPVASLSEVTKVNTSEEPTTRSDTLANTGATQQAFNSLGHEDSEIAESKWQYGIFDRFTRLRSTTTTMSPDISLTVDDIRNYNTDECGLRTYVPAKEEALLSPTFFDDGSPLDLNSRFVPHRRQQLSHKPLDRIDSIRGDANDHPIENNKPIEHLVILSDSQQLNKDRGWAQHKDLEANYESQIREKVKDKTPQLSTTIVDESQISPDGFTNLSGKRSWMDKGQNSTDKSAVSTSDKDRTPSAFSQQDNNSKSSDKKWMDRLDALTLEARVIGGSDARL